MLAIFVSPRLWRSPPVHSQCLMWVTFDVFAFVLFRLLSTTKRKTYARQRAETCFIGVVSRIGFGCSNMHSDAAPHADWLRFSSTPTPQASLSERRPPQKQEAPSRRDYVSSAGLSETRSAAEPAGERFALGRPALPADLVPQPSSPAAFHHARNRDCVCGPRTCEPQPYHRTCSIARRQRGLS